MVDDLPAPDPSTLAPERQNRVYRTSALPLLKQTVPRPADEADRVIALAVYAEIGATWRMLTDVRFKLLGLLPSVSALGLVAIVSSGAPFNGASAAVRTCAAVFGLVVTLGLYIYEVRNSQLYNDLVSRGRRAELELGIDTGVFLGRRSPTRRLINHSTALYAIYGTVTSAWALAAVAVATKIAP